MTEPMSEPRRLRRERRTIRVMMEIYCRAHHTDGGALCPRCDELLAYAFKRIHYCPYGDKKPTCANCPIHCYQRQRREEMKEVMRFAGPKMLFRHPYLAIMHIVDGFRKVEHPAARQRDLS